jgi:hypothetical protein
MSKKGPDKCEPDACDELTEEDQVRRRLPRKATLDEAEEADLTKEEMLVGLMIGSIKTADPSRKLEGIKAEFTTDTGSTVSIEDIEAGIVAKLQARGLEVDNDDEEVPDNYYPQGHQMN